MLIYGVTESNEELAGVSYESYLDTDTDVITYDAIELSSFNGIDVSDIDSAVVKTL